MQNRLFLPDIKTEFKDNVYYVLHNDEQLKLFLLQYYEYSRNTRTQIKYDYRNAPFKFPAAQSFEWKWRQETLNIVKSIIGSRSELKILEISPWNHWLTQYISKSNEVVCADYFDDEYDGLKSRKHFKEANWTSVCCDLENLNIFNTKFDLIIVNHSFQFFKDRKKTISTLKNLLTAKGELLLTGLNLFKDFEIKEKRTKEMQAEYSAKGFNSNVRMGKGFLTFENKKDLEKENFKVLSYKYPKFILRNAIAKFFAKKPYYCYAIYAAD